MGQREADRIKHLHGVMLLLPAQPFGRYGADFRQDLDDVLRPLSLGLAVKDLVHLFGRIVPDLQAGIDGGLGEGGSDVLEARFAFGRGVFSIFEHQQMGLIHVDKGL